MPPPLVSISILTYNRKDVTLELLQDLERLGYENLEIIVVDNCSEDGTAEAVQSLFPTAKLLKTEKNIGAVGRNLGMMNAKGKYIITLDDDVFLRDAESVSKLVKIFEEQPDLGCITFRVIHYQTGNVINWDHPYDKDHYSGNDFLTDSILEGASAFRKEVLSKTGYYPESFFISHEGTDLACRIMDLGFNILYTPAITVRHKVSSIARKSWRRYYYDTRNHVWLAVRNYRFWYCLKYVTAKLCITFVYSLLDGFVRYWLKAVWDSCRGLSKELKQRHPISLITERKIKEIRANRPNVFQLIKRRLEEKRFQI